MIIKWAKTNLLPRSVIAMYHAMKPFIKAFVFASFPIFLLLKQSNFYYADCSLQRVIIQRF